LKTFTLSLLLLALAPALPAATVIRILAWDGLMVKVGVSTSLSQFSLHTSEDARCWTDWGRTWIIRGGTNEVVIDMWIVPVLGSKAIFVKVGA
jgi:hypothetical protein